MKKRISILILFIASAIWGVAFVAQKELAVIPVLTTMAFRNLLAASFLFLIIPLIDKISKSERHFITKWKLDFTKHEVLGGVCCGIVLAAASSVQQLGISGDTDAGKAAFISALYVLFVPVFSLIIRKRTSRAAWCGVFIALLGFYLLCIKDGFKIGLSDSTVLLGAALFAIHILLIAHFSPKCDGIRLCCMQFAVAFVLIAPAALISDGAPEFSLIYTVLPELVFFGVFSGGLAYAMQAVGQKHVEPTIASIILSLESVFGAIGGAIMLNERMTPREYAGSLVILFAVVISQLDFKQISGLIKRNKVQSRTDATESNGSEG